MARKCYIYPYKVEKNTVKCEVVLNWSEYIMAILLKDKFKSWEREAQERFDRLKSNEEELNIFFTELYGLQGELDTKVEDKDVSVSLANPERDIKSLISYAVGCMFGRYSLDEEGLIFAGGEFDMSLYKKFQPCADNILLITDDEYFQNDESDIMYRFIQFLTVAYGKETLEDNLEFIVESLGLKGKASNKEKIRKYFVSKFYIDHLANYKKRPIYWQFESGKANGVKILMYLHRYDENLLSRLRTGYISKLRQAYNSRIELRESQKLATINAGESTRYEKEIVKLSKQLKELRAFDEKIGHLALKKISLDLDEGVVVNYDKLQRDPDTEEKFVVLTKGVKEV